MIDTQTGVLTPPVSQEDHLLGTLTAPVTLVEYGDYECPYCGRAYPIVNALKQRLGDSLCLAYRHFPLSQIHPHAELAAEAAEAAGAQGAFWPMHDLLFQHQNALGSAYLLEYAAVLRFDTDRFERELTGRVYQPKVREHFRSGIWSGVNGTPTFFINGHRHDGPWELPDLFAAIQHAMAASR
jgi:protein-disulfide isomerase